METDIMFGGHTLGALASTQRMREIQGMGGSAGFGLSTGHLPLDEKTLISMVADIEEQIKQLERKRDDLLELQRLTAENPNTTQLIKLMQRLGML